MLEKIDVDGFRSLRKFSLELARGLNILIGPNGAGKTNIITFFEFLSHICDGEVSDAIHKVGGVASVIHRDVDGNSPEIKFTIHGTTRGFGSTSGVRYWRYEYSATVKISEELGDIFFADQCIKIINTKYSYEIERPNPKTNWDLVVSSRSDGTESGSIVKLERIDRRKFNSLAGRRALIDPDKIEIAVSAALRGEKIYRNSLIQILENYFQNVRQIRNDLKSGEVYNIYPGSVKDREDISTPVGVRPDGSGTSATLLALSRLSARAPTSSHPTQTPLRTPFRLVPNAYMNIVKFLRIVNESISGIRISMGEIDGFINIFFQIKTDNGDIDVPIQRMSDGTVKWLALVTAIHTNRVMFAIEEPENYLHPYMQQQIIGIIRNAFSSNNTRGFALVSTHSETLLNAATPSEVIVVSMKEGRTQAKRPSDPDQLSEIIAETGFGLGTIYVTGGLDDA